MRKNKFFITLLIIIMTLSMALVGCGDKNKIPPADTTNAPDYSASDKQFTIWAYGATCDDWYMLNGKKYFFPSSLQTPEHTQLYKDGGFNLMFIDYTFSQSSMVENYKFEGSKLNRVMDMVYEKGLKSLVYQPDIHSLSNCEESLINPEKADGKKFFKDEQALNDYVEKALVGLKDHPGFYGVTLIDEPGYNKFKAIGQVYRAIMNVCPNAHPMINILPLADTPQHKALYAKNGHNMTVGEAYRSYLETYYQEVGQYSGYVQYDDYPVLAETILPTYFQNIQILSDFAKEKGIDRRMSHQTCEYAERRIVHEPDMWWQLNISMALGTKEYTYYTYYPTVNTNGTLPNENAHIVNRLGDPNPLYYALKNIHKEMQFNAKALMNFDFNGLTYKVKTPAPTGNYIANVKKNTMKHLKDFDFNIKIQSGGMVFITELYDKTAKRYGYYVVNATDPLLASEVDVTLDFGDFKNAQIYQYSTVNNVGTMNGKVNLHLGTGRGAFVMPY